MMAIMPPDDLRHDIEKIRFEFSEKYHAKEALKPPVHITVVPPFKTQETVEELLINVFTRWGETMIPFPITLKGYDIFPKNGVIFINVIQTDLLKLFQKDLAKAFKQTVYIPGLKNTMSFHPHITIGYRDIPRELFPLAAKEYVRKEFFSVFVLDKFYLWKHDGIRWQVKYMFEIGQIV